MNEHKSIFLKIVLNLLNYVKYIEYLNMKDQKKTNRCVIKTPIFLLGKLSLFNQYFG